MQLRNSQKTNEHNSPETYGHRISLTRLSIWLGFLSSLILTILKQKGSSIKTKAKIIQALVDADYVKEWPVDSEVLLSISPTAIRVATLSLKDLTVYEKRFLFARVTVNESDGDDNDDYESHEKIAYEEKSRQLLRLIYLSAFISPILIALPLSLFYQILKYQDISSSLPTTLGVLIASFILVPILLELPTMTSTIKTYKTNYYVYLVAYIGIFIGIVGYLYTLKPLQSIISKELKSAQYYLTVIAEISVSNVIFGNFILFCIQF
ncbi:unnamed protein product [Didymodactylos carnosus]|uniref:Uncharacterized protein n=1 Tax=Didymodactylos carnosus TaxID=1234261 RepID=A0A814PL47_9BILA|nr:unnamed protein product [Didymodactylos carnosus]CAF3872127.1 unnamed protein product [Didymodactylos carnosus]